MSPRTTWEQGEAWASPFGYRPLALVLRRVRTAPTALPTRLAAPPELHLTVVLSVAVAILERSRTVVLNAPGMAAPVVRLRSEVARILAAPPAEGPAPSWPEWAQEDAGAGGGPVGLASAVGRLVALVRRATDRPSAVAGLVRRATDRPGAVAGVVSRTARAQPLLVRGAPDATPTDGWARRPHSVVPVPTTTTHVTPGIPGVQSSIRGRQKRGSPGPPVLELLSAVQVERLSTVAPGTPGVTGPAVVPRMPVSLAAAAGRLLTAARHPGDTTPYESAPEPRESSPNPSPTVSPARHSLAGVPPALVGRGGMAASRSPLAAGNRQRAGLPVAGGPTPTGAVRMLRPSQRVLATGGPGRGGIGRSAATTRSAIEENAPGPRRAATRVHRVSPDAAAPAPAGPPQQIVSPAPSESARSVLDLDEIGRDLWDRFEKRMRIEQERRGRG